ncbi:DUF4845 domain-containing protein [Teredinibacter turnerae]|uniref:DUF4845 domain-containing protein n=1 Tax=Teredinibacter turnerae TaxID=2426 RepID=UPI00036A03E9|nr:DUF4845 domain-containing protein [Teredinibacter turnerae]
MKAPESILWRQSGLGSISWLLILAVAGFVLTCAFKLGPHYIDNMSIKDALKSLTEQPRDINTMDKNEISKILSNYMMINNVRGQEANSIKIVRKKDKTLVNSEYEVRVPLMLNIDVVLKFRSQLDSSNPEACCEFLVENETKPAE